MKKGKYILLGTEIELKNDDKPLYADHEETVFSKAVKDLLRSGVRIGSERPKYLGSKSAEMWDKYMS